MPTIKQIASDLASSKASSVEITQNYLEKIKKQNEELNCFVLICEEQAIKMAKASDERRSKGQAVGVLDGVPLAIKDLYCTKNIRTTSCSQMLKNFIPPYESTATQRAWDAGAVLLGKTNMDEFAMGSATSRSVFGKCFSPLKLDGVNLTPGGSSGGSVSAVAAGLAPASFGSDTGGSIRQPAAFCGLVGFKPTYGRISRYGMIAYASSFDQAGFFGRTLEDTAILTQICAGPDGLDSTLTSTPLGNLLGNIPTKLNGLKIAVSPDFITKEMDGEILKSYNDCLNLFKKLGAEIVEVAMPNIKYSLNVYYFISTAEASSNLARFDGVRYGHQTSKKFGSYEEFISLNRAEGFCDEVKNRILIGTQALLKDNYTENYEKILRLRQKIRNDYDEAFKKADIVFLPTVPSLPPKHDYKYTQIEEYMCDILTVSLNVAGLGGVSIPTANSADGRPIGMQLVYPAFGESKMFPLAQLLERELNYKHPILG